MKAWKKGAIVGAIYSIVGLFIGGLLVLAAGTRADKLTQFFILLLALPAGTYNILHKKLAVQYVFDNEINAFVYRTTGDNALPINLILWIFIGALIGYIYSRWRDEK